MPANRKTTLNNATGAERVKIISGVNKLVSLAALPCDILECIVEQFAENATPDERADLKGTLEILLSRLK